MFVCLNLETVPFPFIVILELKSNILLQSEQTRSNINKIHIPEVDIYLSVCVPSGCCFRHVTLVLLVP